MNSCNIERQRTVYTVKPLAAFGAYRKRIRSLIDSTMLPKLILVLLLLIGTACHRPSAKIGATLTPVPDSAKTVSRTEMPKIADYSRYLKAGDEFMAIGNEPSWSLVINSSKNYLRFKTSGADSISVPMPQRNVDSNGRVRFSAETSQGTLTVLFRPDSCVDSMLGQQFDYRVDVTYNGKTYAGCGASLRELSLLNDIWVLQTLNGQTISATAGRGGPPRLDIQLAEGRVTGTTGCNRLTGPLKADTRQLKFGSLATTRMACMGETARLEGDFLETLSQTLTYRVANGMLTLLHDNKPVMTFRKTD